MALQNTRGAGVHRDVVRRRGRRRTETDGRKLRADDNRRRIARAMLELLRSGETDPSAERVAEHAGVGRRTVFRLFDDMDGVYREMHAIMLARIEPILAAPIAGATPRERLFDIVERRARVFEEILPVKTAADTVRHRSRFLQKGHARLTAMQREIILFVAPKTVARETLEALDLALSFETWRRLRREQRLTVKGAKVIVRRMVEALLR
jgi:AcrR family transcriptional regulator